MVGFEVEHSASATIVGVELSINIPAIYLLHRELLASAHLRMLGAGIEKTKQ